MLRRRTQTASVWRVDFGESFAIFICRKWESHPNFTFHSPSVQASRSPSGKNLTCVSRIVGFVWFVLFFVLYKVCSIQSSNSSATMFGSRISPNLLGSLCFWGKFCEKKGQYYFTLFCGLQEGLRSEPGTKYFPCILQRSPSEVTVTR